MTVFILPTRGSTPYKGKYPYRARSISGYVFGPLGRHIELNNGVRLWSADRYAPAIYRDGHLSDDFGDVRGNAVPMTGEQYAVLLSASEKLRERSGIARDVREGLEAEVRAMVEGIKACSTFYAKRNAEAARVSAVDGSAGRAITADKPFRVYNSSPNFKGCFDFATLDEARDYLAAQVNRRQFITSGAAPVGEHSDSIDPLRSFIVWAEGTETLADEFFGYRPDSEDRLWKPAPLKLRGFIDATSDLSALPSETVSEVPMDAPAAAVVSARTIDVTPTWEGLVPAFLALIENGNAEGRATAVAELTRMAKAADKANAYRAQRDTESARAVAAEKLAEDRLADAVRYRGKWAELAGGL